MDDMTVNGPLLEAGEGVVTSIERQPKHTHRFNVFVDGSFAFAVHEDVLVKHRLLKGTPIDRERWAEIAADEERQAAWMDALNYLGRRPHSNRETRQYLKRKGYAADRIEEVIRRLQEQRYLDDGEFACLWAEHRIHSQKKGRRWVQQELKQKGVAPNVIQEALTRIDPEEELDAAVEVGAKRWRSLRGERQERRRKVAAFLMRRGYASSLVREALRRIEAQAGESNAACEDEREDEGI